MKKIYLKKDVLFIVNDRVQDFASFFNSYKLGKSLINQILNGRAKVNGILVNNLNYQLQINDIITIDVSYAIDFIPSGNMCNIVYEDDLVLIVKKKASQIIHDDSSNQALVNDVATYYTLKGYNRHIRYIHRLDKETQGLVFFSKLDFFGPYYNEQLANKKIKREYLAIVKGKMKNCLVENKIGKDRHVNNKYRISKTGKMAKTKFNLLKYHNGYSLVHCELFTGRTHQIRVHLASLGFPIVNDIIYGTKDKNFKYMGLYAYKLTFEDIIKNTMLSISDDVYEDLNYFKMD